MKRLVKVTIHDFSQLKENLHDPGEITLYEAANGQTYDAEIEHDGYAVIELDDGHYLELAPGEYQIIIADWKNAGQIGELVIETKSDPDDDTALLYRSVDQHGREVAAPRSLPKQLVQMLAKTWFGENKKSMP
jgi:hypothetical protein